MKLSFEQQTGSRTRFFRHRFSRHLRSLLCATALVGVALAEACVVAPYNGQIVAPWDVDFAGYAQNPGATLEIQGKDSRTGAWITIATAESGTSPASIDGGETELYYWRRPDVDTSDTAARCFWGEGSNCSVPPGSASAEFRVVEQGSNLSALITFDHDGVSCVSDGVTGGKTWLTAGWDCRSDEWPVLRLVWIT